VSFEGGKDSGDCLNGYCALEYRAHDKESLDPDRVIAIARSSGIGALAIRVHPSWRKIVAAEDHSMIESLFIDFKSRAQSNSDELFKQLSMLSVGSLVTFETGRHLNSSPMLLQLYERFKEI
jgi:hypothetical protein